MPGKSSRAPPYNPLGGAFCFYLVAMGTTGKSPLTHCSWPQTPSVGTSHARQDTTWAVTFLLGRNGHDGAGEASPDPLLLASDPISWHIAYKIGHNLGSYHTVILVRYTACVSVGHAGILTMLRFSDGGVSI